METSTSAIATVGLVVAVVAALPVTGFAAAAVVNPGPGTGVGSAPTASVGGAADHGDAANASANGSIAPGAVLSGVVGVQKVEIEGELRARAFGVRLANATSNASKASVIAAELDGLHDRLGELREERTELRGGRKNGSISRDEYEARLAVLNTKAQSVTRLANLTENATQAVPAELLRERGVNATAIRTLRRNASELTGPETAAIARRIAGPGAGTGLGNRPADAGPPGRNGSESGPPGQNDSTGPPGQNDSAGPPGQNGSAGPPGGNDSASPPASPGNRTDGNETRGDPGRADNAADPADGAGNATEPADDAGNATEPGGGTENGTGSLDRIEPGSTYGGALTDIGRPAFRPRS